MLKQEEIIDVKAAEKTVVASAVKIGIKGINTIFKGSKVAGNMVVSQDLQMNGDLEGNITAENNASVFINGTYRGNIDAKGGSVEIEGEMSGGNISAGGYVKVTGKFLGNKIQARDKININGEFTGYLESNEVELGAAARGKGEILYRETLCIQKGAKMEGKITRAEGEKNPNETRNQIRREVSSCIKCRIRRRRKVSSRRAAKALWRSDSYLFPNKNPLAPRGLGGHPV